MKKVCFNFSLASLTMGFLLSVSAYAWNVSDQEVNDFIARFQTPHIALIC